jgi:hypothetical protein
MELVLEMCRKTFFHDQHNIFKVQWTSGMNQVYKDIERAEESSRSMEYGSIAQIVSNDKVEKENSATKMTI